MLSLAKARKDYYLQKLGEISPREDYYLRGGTATGQWHGQGAAEAGLEGTVSTEGLVRLFDGEHPATGEQLGRRLRKDGVAAWDLTFSADKSVSLLWALGGNEVRRHVLEAFEEATQEALSYMEEVASSTRGATRVPVFDEDGNQAVDEEGRPRVNTETWPIKTTGYVAAWFTEYTSRADDPQLHAHIVVANRVKGVDGVWRTLDGRLLYRHKLAAGYLHEAELRQRLTRRLGVRWQSVDKGMADIEGFTRSQIEAFSQRRQQIDQWRIEHGVEDTPANNETIALATRDPKTDRPLADLISEWQDRAQAVGLTPERIAAVLDHSHEITLPDPEHLFAELLSETGLTTDEATFGRPEVVTAISAGLPEGGTRQQVEALADRCLHHEEVLPLLHRQPEPQSKDLDDRVAAGDHSESLADRRRERRYTTVEMLATEQHVIDRALTGVGVDRWTAPDVDVDKALDHSPHLTEGQRQLVRHLASSGNAVDIGVGPAGTGKSTALAVVRELAGQTGTPIFGTALAARAAAGFEASTGIPSTTLTRLLGKDPETGSLPDRSIVVVDEAGMVGTRHLAGLIDLVESAAGKLILVGDHHQLPEIHAGGLFSILARRLPAVELTENVRQAQEWERDALIELRGGSVSRAIAMYRRRGRLSTAPTPGETIGRAVDHWHRDVQATGDASMVLLIGHDNRTVRHLNEDARARLAGAGLLRGPILEISGRQFQAGDRVICRRNRPSLGVLNGDLATVVSVNVEGRTVTVRLDSNSERRTLSTEYLDTGHLNHGYALTGHKAQGATSTHAHAVVTDRVDREWIYVAMSRGEEANTMHVLQRSEHDECDHLQHLEPAGIDALLRSLDRTGSKGSATGLEATAPQTDSSDLSSDLRFAR